MLIIPIGFLILVCNAGLTALSYRSLNKDAAGEGEARPSRLLRFLPDTRPARIILFAIVLIICWSPYLVAVFPGTIYNDTAVQMQQIYPEAHPLDVLSGGNIQLESDEIQRDYGSLKEDVVKSKQYHLTDAWLVDHHPFALTLLYGGLASASDALFGNWMPALAFLMIIQTLVLALELAYCTAYLRKRAAPPSLCLTGFLFFCFLPFIPLAASLIVKDTAFTLLFIPWFLMLADCLFMQGECFLRKRRMIGFILLAVGMCLTKKTGVYVVCVTALFGIALFAVRIWRAKRAAKATDALSLDESASLKSALHTGNGASALAFLLQGGICALLMFVIVPGIIFPWLNISPGGRQEMLGTLFQQTARVYSDHGKDAMTPEERKAIAGVMRTTDLEWTYSPASTDKVKIGHYLDASDEQMRDYLDAYGKIGLRYPDSYAASIVCTAAGYLSPVEPYDPALELMAWDLAFDEEREVLWPIQGTGPLREAVQAFLVFWNNVPILNLLLRGVTYCLWVPLALLFFCVRNRLKGGFLFVPWAMVALFCILGPEYQVRYFFPLIMLAPVLLGMMVALAKQAFKERGDKQRSLDASQARI